MNQTVIGSAPDAVRFERRWRDGINHAATIRLLSRFRFVFSDARGQVVLRPRQIGANLFPVNALIARSPERVSGEKKQMRIDRRKDNWLGAHHPEILRLHRHRQDCLGLTGSPIESGQFAADDDVRIERIGDNITVFLRRDWVPVAKCDFAVVAATCDSNRTALLLATIKTIRKRVVRAHVIQLRSRLIVP